MFDLRVLGLGRGLAVTALARHPERLAAQLSIMSYSRKPTIPLMQVR